MLITGQQLEAVVVPVGRAVGTEFERPLYISAPGLGRFFP